MRSYLSEGFKFIDLFAGIGGFRTALEDFNGECVLTCEWDKHSQQTYRAWHGEDKIFGDIRELSSKEIPFHDVLAAGFPCQPFSIAGVSKKNALGRAHGFNCESQGNLFFKIAEIVEAKGPSILLLENVKNLVAHDRGRTWKTIEATLIELGYSVFMKVIDAKYWVPQHRERTLIVCFQRHIYGSSPIFSFPALPSGPLPQLVSILDSGVDPKYTLSDHLWNYLQAYAEKHRQAGNGFGYGLVDINGQARTLSARYHKDGSEILIPQTGKNPRRLTPQECCRLMGFPEKQIVVSDTQAYRQFGNAVVPEVIRFVFEAVLRVPTLTRPKWRQGARLRKPTVREPLCLQRSA